MVYVVVQDGFGYKNPFETLGAVHADLSEGFACTVAQLKAACLTAATS